MPDVLPHNPADMLAPNLAPSTQHRIRVLDEITDRSANLMRMIEHQCEQLCKVAQLNFDQPQDIPVSPPAPLITDDAAGAFEKLGRSIRFTVALAEKLEHPAAAAPQQSAAKPAQPKIFTEHDLARMTDAELDEHIAAAERESEREAAEKYHAEEKAEDIRFRALADTIDEIYQNLGLPPLPEPQEWQQRFILQITALYALAAEHKQSASATTDPPAPPDSS